MSLRVNPFAGVTRTFLMKIFLFGAQLFKNVEMDETIRADYNMRISDIPMDLKHNVIKGLHYT